MSFAAPHLLWLLLAPACWLAWELSRRARATEAAHPKILRAEAGANSLRLSALQPFSSSALPRGGTPRIRWRLHLGLAFAVLALARPQWGRIEEPVFAQSRDILLTLDLSRSMLAEDVKPTRLARAKLLVQSLLEKLRGERVGLLVFSGTAFLQSPLSTDYEILREFLPALGPDHLPEGGSNYDAMLETAAQSFGDGDADRFLIVLSDGEANDDSWRARLDTLKAKNIRVLGLALGTAEGAFLPDGAGGFVKDARGAVVLSKREDATLRALAEATGGAQADASNWVDLAQLLDATVAQGRRGEFREAGRVRLAERFQWALAPALLLLAWSFWREFPVRPRPRALALRDGLRPTPALATIAHIFPILLILLLSLLPSPARAVERTDLAPADRLAHTVAKLAGQDARDARDWVALADATLAWGEPLQTDQQPVAEGPVRDALAAADLGEKLDRRAADWPALRTRLEKLLEKSDDQKQPQPNQQPQNSPQDQKQSDSSKDQNSPQDQQQQNQSQQSDSAKNQSPSNQSGDPSSPQQQQPQSPDQKDPSQPFPSSQPPPDQNSASNPPDKNSPAQPPKAPPPPSGQQSLGEMKSPQPPPPASAEKPPGEMQQVGGVPAGAAPVMISDPALAAQLRKLEQLRDRDSPVLLFQRMREQDGTPRPPVNKDRNW